MEMLLEVHNLSRFRIKRGQLGRFERRGQNLALTVLYVPYSLDGSSDTADVASLPDIWAAIGLELPRVHFGGLIRRPNQIYSALILLLYGLLLQRN